MLKKVNDVVFEILFYMEYKKTHTHTFLLRWLLRKIARRIYICMTLLFVGACTHLLRNRKIFNAISMKRRVHVSNVLCCTFCLFFLRFACASPLLSPPSLVTFFDAWYPVFYGRSPRHRGDGDTVRSSGSRTCKQVRLVLRSMSKDCIEGTPDRCQCMLSID